jgi:hypothetical protein
MRNGVTIRPASKVRKVLAADGKPLTLADLPFAHAQRWTVRHKANVVAAVRGGLIGLKEACQRYNLTREEFSSWSEAVDQFGIPGLRATKTQQYRRRISSEQSVDLIGAMPKTLPIDE